ncbi:alpha/beta fold hydrolase [Pedobacter sp. PF22-3]|uniref:thioesterase II family protein n=1 Tax=Pedobacter sp. PF22-3 TaxID=2994467 RepID=UPI0022456F45|nr:alpha/beta fold hydrolase [Pedobacter sp. PF22-3]MCX2492870.1 alpha/beta fold hydrolase [Pedobacter sp. PF22-3]
MNKIDQPTIFMLHFAGGNTYSFNPISAFLKDFNLVTPELPGRGNRMNEALIKDFESAAEDLFFQILTKPKVTEYLIFGHSMGASLAVKLAAMLENIGRPPIATVVSGNAGPGTGKKKNTYLLNPPGFRAELEKLGGISEQIFEHEELFGFFEPILRADFEVVQKHPLQIKSVNTPIYAIMGSEEDTVSEISNWRKFTTAEFDYKVLPGNHFFLFDHCEKMAEIIRHCYKRYKIS